MFERSLVESRGLVVSRAQRWSAVGSATFQVMLAALIVTVPLLRPQTMKFLATAPHLELPPVLIRQPQPVHVSMTNAANATPSAPLAHEAPAFSSPGTRVIFPQDPETSWEGGQPGPIDPMAMGHGSNPMPTFGSGTGAPTAMIVRAAQNRPINLSGGVSAGMLLSPIQPAYPQIARIAHVQGSVVVEAIIAKNGRIESAHVKDGPPMLRQAALEAVETARYRPYLLSGEPVEVETTITVNFRLGQ